MSGTRSNGKGQIAEADQTPQLESASERPFAVQIKRSKNAQPNLHGLEVPVRLWPAILLTGALSGLAGGLLMRLLRVVQHFCFDYQQGNFLSGVEGVSGEHRVVVLACAGLLAGVVLLFIRKKAEGDEPDLTDAIWNHHGDLPEKHITFRASFYRDCWHGRSAGARSRA